MSEIPQVRLVRRTPPGGFGRAIRSGLKAVRGDVVVIYMADRSDDPQDVVACFRGIERGGYDCVFGSRFRRGSRVRHYPLVKLIVNRIVNRCIQVMFWTRFNDLTNAFKAYRTEVIRDCGPFQASHFNITLELSLSALIRGYRIAEIPISWSGRQWGASHLRLREMGRRYLSTLLMMFFQRILIADDLRAECRYPGGDGVTGLSRAVEPGPVRHEVLLTPVDGAVEEQLLEDLQEIRLTLADRPTAASRSDSAVPQVTLPHAEQVS